MAGALAGGALLSGFFNILFDRLSSPDAFNLLCGKKLDQHLIDRLKNALSAAEVLLVDAEQKQITNPSVKKWLGSLRDAVYKADDLLDRFFTEAATGKQETLKLRSCKKLSMLPSGMQNLANLRHLDIWETDLKEMPPGMSKLKQLQVLTDFFVGQHGENGIKELGGLLNLNGSLKISKLENITKQGRQG